MRRDSLLPAAPAALALAAVAAIWVLGRGANPGPIGFPLDDAWIHMVYGRGILVNGYLAYEDGMPSTGCTSPAWALVLAVLHALFARGAAVGGVVASVMVAGAALHVAAAQAAAGLARRVGAGVGTAVVAGGIVAVAPLLAAASLSGMEVALTAWLLLRGTAAAAEGRATIAGVWLALAGWARPESAAVLLVVAAYVVMQSPPRERLATAGRILGPPLLAGAAFVGYDLWASGAPLPATFYAKTSAALPDLPRRLLVAIGRIVDAVPPFGFALGWVAAAGVVVAAAAPGDDGAGSNGAAPKATARLSAAKAVPAPAAPLLPLVAGLTYLVANVSILDPKDPAAFYHQRYVLPAVPLLVVAAALGARAWGRVLGRRSRGPLAIVAVAAALQAAVTFPAVSRHLHNDTRNINEVQRRLGEELGAAFPPGTRIAASDAGAIRYFSRLPTLDVLGLNTAGMLSPTEAYARAHPVAALAFLPAWFRTPDSARLTEMFRAETANYTVTSNPRMALMVVVRPRDGVAPLLARFAGFRSFAVEFGSPDAARSANVPGAP